MKRYFITDNGMNIHITEWGPKHRPVIFCLHGLGSTSLSFIEIAEELKEEYRIIAIDAPGHGKTTPFMHGEHYEMNHIVHWWNRILDKLDIERFYFLSHSWGSSVAFYYLIHYPNRVQGTIAIDGGYQTKRYDNLTMNEEANHYEEDFDSYVFDSWPDFMESEKSAYSRWNSLLERAVKDLGVEDHNKIRWHASGATARHIIKAMHKNETEDIYHLLPPTITLLRATVPKRLEEYRKKTAAIFTMKTGGTVVTVDDATHLLHWDYPSAVIDEVRKNWIESDNKEVKDNDIF